MAYRTHDGTQDRDMTQNEIAELEHVRAEMAAQAAALDAAAAAKISAKTKLAGLGLTDTEIAALLGA